MLHRASAPQLKALPALQLSARKLGRAQGHLRAPSGSKFSWSAHMLAKKRPLSEQCYFNCAERKQDHTQIHHISLGDFEQ